MTTARPEPTNGDPAPETVTGLPVLYSAEAVAQALGLRSTNWLEEAARHKRIPHIRIGRRLRFTREQVDLAIQFHTIPQVTPEPPAQDRPRRTPTVPKPHPRRLQARVPARMRKAAAS